MTRQDKAKRLRREVEQETNLQIKSELGGSEEES